MLFVSGSRHCYLAREWSSDHGGELPSLNPWSATAPKHAKCSEATVSGLEALLKRNTNGSHQQVQSVQGSVASLLFS